MSYTLAQVNAFLAADARLEHERLAALLTVMAVAAQGSRESIQQLQRELQRHSR
ncbi:hypothetical protein OOT46_23140 [Aquabacterium sp. A7-Y]|uniref:hypothetical protein n=1 Tax=Aquabacterium sp. A7-Y TaxID=1349605 RepID=UPI00223E8C40|nr:hypothetical protein [Aquabacterium sp. A7-Y]MCW7540718.1 hypothetical protein [Aquabacterium sp. A7-Y]